ncbi:group II intron maturase-specific domain-containing protein [Streptomyces sp. NPDC059862]|uniref:group II intron maturase-specific domain-containing protein n=1 Tax=unclassified Streptomyces TaxID=2593676 RepID=UPI0036387E46
MVDRAVLAHPLFTGISTARLVSLVEELACPWAAAAEGQRERVQGGVISPLMCNVYLHRLDRAWDEHDGGLVRYADDVVVMYFSRSQAERALARLVELLGELGLRPKESKTRIVHLMTDQEGFDFFGFHHRQVRSRGLHGRRRFEFLARWPSNRPMQHARDRIREITARRRLPLHPEAIVEDLNLFLRGWMAYLRYGHSARRFSKIGRFTRERVAHFISRKHRRSRAFGWWVLTVSSPNELGLISPYGTVVPPGPESPGGKGRMPSVNGVGEPCAGEPHARFEAAGAGNGAEALRHRAAPDPTTSSG